MLDHANLQTYRTYLEPFVQTSQSRQNSLELFLGISLRFQDISKNPGSQDALELCFQSGIPRGWQGMRGRRTGGAAESRGAMPMQSADRGLSFSK